MGSPHPSYSSVPEVSIYRPLQRFFLQQIIQQFNETDPDIPVPSNLDELKTSHFYQTQPEEEAEKKRTLCDFFLKEARKNINRSVSPLNRRCLYLWLWKPFKNHKNSKFKINDKYLELLFAFFEVPFVFSDIEDYLDHRQHNLKNDYNQDIREEELLEQIEEFKKIEHFQRQEFYYRCYISDVSGITKGILLVERDFQNDSLLATLTIQRQSDNPSMEGNEIEYSGTLEEGGGFAYLDFKNREPNFIIKCQSQ